MNDITNQEFKIVKPAMDKRGAYLIAIFILFFFSTNWIEQLGVTDGPFSNILVVLFTLLLIITAIWIRTVPKNFKTIGRLKFSNETIEIKTKLNIDIINIVDLIRVDFRFSGTLGDGNGGFNISFGQMAKEDGSGNLLTLNTETSSYYLNLFLVSKKQKIELECILNAIKNKIIANQTNRKIALVSGDT
jgi:hypothetical protein